jgi:hypothetical protein
MRNGLRDEKMREVKKRDVKCEKTVVKTEYLEKEKKVKI